MKRASIKDHGALFATAGNVDGIKEMIAKFYYSEPERVCLTEEGKNRWAVAKGGEQIESVAVVKYAGRYRFVKRAA